MLQIDSIHEESPAALAGLRAGDRITKVNGQPVRDLLDFHFHVGDEGDVQIEILRDAGAQEIAVARDGGPDLGLSFAPLRTRLCGNACVFCFIDQNPAGMRQTLYVKDEDYRLSFLHGNFVTLTNMKEWEIQRIVEQHLSPLYISVHSTDPAIRRRLLRQKVERDIMPTLDYFRDSGIVMHTQIVLCPGYNDGADLEKTVRDLAAYHPAVQSLAVVPLGMTDHREGLVALDPVTPKLAERILASAGAWQREFHARWGIRFIYLADEWYRLLGRAVPPETWYDGYPQIENGIGMTRHFLNRLSRLRTVFPEAGRRGCARVTLVTADLFRETLENAVRDKLARTGEPLAVDFVGVHNDFFGRKVTVSGLLTGRDIAAACRGRDLGDLVLLPPATLNEDNVFLDDLSLRGLEELLGTPIQVGFRDRFW